VGVESGDEGSKSLREKLHAPEIICGEKKAPGISQEPLQKNLEDG